MVYKQQFSVKLVTFTVHFEPINAAAAVVVTVLLPSEVVILLHDTPAVREGVPRPQLTAQVVFLLPDEQLHRGIGIIAKAVIYIFIKDAGACAERHPPPAIRKQGVGVVMKLGDGQGAVQHHPMNEIGHLAQPAAGIGTQAPGADGKPRQIAFFRRCSAYGMPKGKGLARFGGYNILGIILNGYHELFINPACRNNLFGNLRHDKILDFKFIKQLCHRAHVVGMRMSDKNTVKRINVEILYVADDGLSCSDLARIDKYCFAAASEQCAITLSDINEADVHLIGIALLCVPQSGFIINILEVTEKP